ncbi:MAG: glutamate-1-semialdehyde 2,1-aminomutase [Bdellovibrionales bacterium]
MALERMTSEALFERSQEVAPGGVHSPVRAFRSVGGTPVFFVRGEGAMLHSVEGRAYIDFCQSFGPNILGHRDPDVERVLKETVELGWSFGACEPYSLELAEIVKHEVSAVERIRFVCSGTEAVMSALRVARAATGRESILKFEGCYHGHADALLVKAGSGLAGPAASDSAGVTENLARQTLTCPLDDEAALEKVFREHGSHIAAVIIEPMPANYGLLLQRPEYLQAVAKIARANGSLLIFDEVISGFRVHMGGMIAMTGITPDLVTYGKVLGGGLAVGAYAGRRELMELVAPAGPVYQAGTLSASPLAMRTGAATLRKLRSAGIHQILDERTAAFVHELRKILHPRWDVTHLGSVFWIHPDLDKPLRSLRDLPPDMGQQFRGLFHALLAKGVYLAPSGYEVGFVSFAHDERLLDQALAKIDEAVRGL